MPDLERRARLGAGLTGVGAGGALDGIVLHQIARWHHLTGTHDSAAASSVGDLETRVLADGLFHAATWALAAVGVGLLWSASSEGRRTMRARPLLGWALIGWGAFNLVEGVVNHHVLRLHRVRPDAGAPWAYDLAFLALGLVLLAIGWRLRSRDGPSTNPENGPDHRPQRTTAHPTPTDRSTP